MRELAACSFAADWEIRDLPQNRRQRWSQGWNSNAFFWLDLVNDAAELLLEGHWWLLDLDNTRVVERREIRSNVQMVRVTMGLVIENNSFA